MPDEWSVSVHVEDICCLARPFRREHPGYDIMPLTVLQISYRCPIQGMYVTRQLEQLHVTHQFQQHNPMGKSPDANPLDHATTVPSIIVSILSTGGDDISTCTMCLYFPSIKRSMCFTNRKLGRPAALCFSSYNFQLNNDHT